VPELQALSPLQLRRLRSAMEEDFARALCVMMQGQAAGASSATNESHRQVRSAVASNGASAQRAQERLAPIMEALRRLDTGDWMTDVATYEFVRSYMVATPGLVTDIPGESPAEFGQ
jgi:hypothetical protein